MSDTTFYICLAIGVVIGLLLPSFIKGFIKGLFQAFGHKIGRVKSRRFRMVLKYWHPYRLTMEGNDSMGKPYPAIYAWLWWNF